MRVLIILFLALAACGRPLTPAEKSFAAQLHGDTIDTSRIRAVRGSPVGSITLLRPKRPRLACRELILPEPEEDLVTVTPVAMVIHNKVFYARDWYLDDFMQNYPERLDLLSAMLFAHEITHVWQWQNRAKTGYSPLRAAREHAESDDPYLFDIDTQTRFLDYGYEQQAGIVEEYVCCAALDPEGSRTNRLKALISDTIPMRDLQVPRQILIPWKDAQLQGICS
ncbi:hypothetical protein AAFO92_19670 [Roseovarius sp. CAU 1744]|uniref:hypothetical protein n=1 Tax=Roseovarius sp. CAU 1744 TaxID=3140368 RepID=UPI00325BF4AB